MKNLYRSLDHKVVGGVAGGLGEYFKVDPVIIRVLFVATALSGGAGLLIYLIMWVIVPARPYFMEEPYQQKERSRAFAGPDGEEIWEDEQGSSFDEEDETPNTTVKTFFGIALLAVGIMMFIDELFPHFNFDYVVPVGLIFLGVYLLLKPNKK